MNSKCNFSYKHYFDVINTAKKKYQIGPLKEFSKLKKKNKFILLRHDVDYSPDLALRMAQAEHKHKIRSTYFFLLHGTFYNALSEYNISIIKKIASMGHEIGLHYDTNLFSKKIRALNQIKQEANILGSLINKKIVSIAQHNVTISPQLTNHKISAFLDARSTEVAKVTTYISDSVQNWRDGCMCKHINKDDKLQILVHPFLWHKHPKSRSTILKEFMKSENKKLFSNIEAVNAMHKRYLNKLKKN